MPEKFALKQLQKLYETILSFELDKRNFIKKNQSMDVPIKLDKKICRLLEKVHFYLRLITKNIKNEFQKKSFLNCNYSLSSSSL